MTRTGRLSLIGALGASVAALVLRPPQDIVLYNPSRSMPQGFYLRVPAPIEPNAIVTVRAPDALGGDRAERALQSHRFLKQVAGVGGDEICAHGEAIFINQALAAIRQSHARNGAPLSNWQGCRILAANEVFLLGQSSDSFDGRYWGPVRRDQIEGVWRPLTPTPKPSPAAQQNGPRPRQAERPQ